MHLKFAFALAAIAATWLADISVSAHEYRRGTLEIDHPWARATPPTAKNGAVYLEIRNTGAVPDRLLAVSTPAAGTATLHRTERDGDILRMREAAPLDIAANGIALLHPGGLHIMLMDLKAPLKVGTEFPLTLRFEKTGAVEIDVRVEQSLPAQTPPTHGH